MGIVTTTTKPSNEIQLPPQNPDGSYTLAGGFTVPPGFDVRDQASRQALWAKYAQSMGATQGDLSGTQEGPLTDFFQAQRQGQFSQAQSARAAAVQQREAEISGRQAASNAANQSRPVGVGIPLPTPPLYSSTTNAANPATTATPLITPAAVPATPGAQVLPGAIQAKPPVGIVAGGGIKRFGYN